MSLIGATNEEKIWNYLYSKLGNVYGVAGIMGNINAESGLKPNNLQNSYEKKLNMTDDQYTAAVDNGSYTNFVYDSAGYGLVQWTYWSLKRDFLAYVQSKGASIGDLEIQLEFLCKQLSESYTSSVWNVCKSATSVLQASNAMLLKFERPADQSEAVQSKRAGYGQVYYNKYATKATTTPTQTTTGSPTTTGGTSMSVTLCHASISENGNAGWDGKSVAGDQTGKEVCTRSWYNKPWDIMIRYPNADIAKKAAAIAKKLADSNLVGYDQSQRNTLYQQLKKNNFDVDAYIRSGVKTETDCSAFVYACYACCITAMRSDKNAPVTSNMRSKYKSWGFTIYTDSKYITQDKYLMVGDLLVKESTHTVMAITNGASVDSSSPVISQPSANNTSLCGKGIGIAVATTAMNVRTGNSTNYSILTTIKSGTSVEVLEITSNGWYKIVWPGASCGYAYVSNSTGKYFKYTAKATAPVSSNYLVKVTANALNIRKGPGTSYAVVGCIRDKGVYTIVQEQDGWGKLKSGAGWISLAYTQKR